MKQKKKTVKAKKVHISQKCLLSWLSESQHGIK